MKNGSHRNGSSPGAPTNGTDPLRSRHAPPAADDNAAGEGAFFVMTRAECEALYAEIRTCSLRDYEAQMVLKRMTEALR